MGAPELFNAKITDMKIATHNGPFHCDDVLAVAVLKKLYPDAEIVRTRDNAIMDACDIVLDVGMIYDHDKKRYDHHQLGRAGERANGIAYSALGLIWRHYGLEWCAGDSEAWRYIDDYLVQYVDAEDNGHDVFKLTDLEISPVTIGSLVDWFRPAYGEEQNFDERFGQAVEWGQDLLEKLLARAQGSLRAEQKAVEVYAASDDPRLLVMDEFIPLGKQAEAMTGLLFHVYPDINGMWRIKAIRKQKGSFENRKDLPASWAGLTGAELQALTSVSDAEFCHNALFIAGARTKEGAIKMAKLALEA